MTASNPYINKVVYDNTTLIDLTSDTAESGDVLLGKAFHLATGQASTGTAVLATASVVNKNLILTNGFPVSIGSSSSSSSQSGIPESSEWTDVGGFTPGNGDDITPIDNPIVSG